MTDNANGDDVGAKSKHMEEISVSLRLSAWEGVIGAILLRHAEHDVRCECDKVADSIIRQVKQQTDVCEEASDV